MSKSKESGAIEEDEAFHAVGQLLDSLLSDMLTKRTDVKEKKRPARFTAEQKEVLEKTFAVEQFVKGARMATLRQEVGLSKEQVSKWFMQRRALERKKKKVESSTVTVIANVSQVTTTEGAGKDEKKRALFTAQQMQKLESAFAEEQFIRGARLASLVQEVVPRDDLRAHVRALAEEIAANAPLAVQVIKRTVNFRAEQGMAEALRFEAASASPLFVSDDMAKGYKAMAAKEDPGFEGK